MVLSRKYSIYFLCQSRHTKVECMCLGDSWMHALRKWVSSSPGFQQCRVPILSPTLSSGEDEKPHGKKIWLGPETIWQKEQDFFACYQQICHHSPSWYSPSPTEGGVDFEHACGKAGEEKGEHRKILWKPVYLGLHRSGTKLYTLDLLNHRSNIFPTCRPLNCVTASVFLRVAQYSLQE